MFAKYIGCNGYGLIKGIVYFINVSEIAQEYRRISVSVGDWWQEDYNDYKNFKESWKVIK